MIPNLLPQIDAGERAIRQAFTEIGYVRRASKKKGFSNDPRVMRQRLEFAEQGIQWTRERLYRQIFSDEVWAMGGGHTTSYVTILEDGSDRFLTENLHHKYSKAPAWMFWGSIVDGRKGPAVFWEKEWGTVNSFTYDLHILREVQLFMQTEGRGRGYIYMQDNAPAHRSYETQRNLLIRRIETIKHPPYSPDLNIIEHVWNWIKNWIQDHYFEELYRVDRLDLARLREIIWQAWQAVPEEYIRSLFDSWWSRCRAVIEARGGPTKY
jgi:transposase